MGIEYEIICDAKAVAEFDTFLRRQLYFESYDAELSLANCLNVPIAFRERVLPVREFASHSKRRGVGGPFGIVSLLRLGLEDWPR
jgi:hypothetical protein